MAIEWTPSADRHGISREEAQWAMAHAFRVESEFGHPRPPHTQAPTLYIGPSRYGTLEVLVAAQPPRTLVVFHVMLLRESTARAVGYEPQ